MKRALLLALMAMASLAARSQGTIYFSNHVPSAGIDSPVFSSDGTTRIEGSAFRAQLWVGGPGARLPDYVSVGPAVPMGTGQLAGYYDTSLDPIRVVPSTPPGTYVWVQARVWSVQDGPTLEEVIANNPNAVVSLSYPLWIETGDAVNPAFMKDAVGVPPSHFNYPASVLVPEPSIAAMLCLSGMVFVRRVRKR